MKVIFFLISLLVVTNFTLKAQSLITVQNGSTVSFYSKLDSAITFASNEDTIYLPGGGFTLSVPIDKLVHIIGVGHNPDSTIATNRTIIASDIYILATASFGSIEGIYCRGSIKFGTSILNQNVTNFKLSRCYVTQGTFLGFAGTSNSNNNLFFENIFHGIYFLNSMNNLIYNNIIVDYAKDVGLGNDFKNNQFNNSSSRNYTDGYFWYGIQASIVNAVGSQFDNNIFRGRLISAGGYNNNFSNNNFNNNLFSDHTEIGSPLCNGCIDFNCFFNQLDSNILLNYPDAQNFEYFFDNHLKMSSGGKKSGTDGTDIGIYGGIFPWKNGSLPANPHIQFKQIANSTDQNGNLKLNIKVKAQNN